VRFQVFTAASIKMAVFSNVARCIPEEIGMKLSWPNFKVLSQHLPGGIVENHEKSAIIVGFRADI
jgi:hypothetical protein